MKKYLFPLLAGLSCCLLIGSLFQIHALHGQVNQLQNTLSTQSAQISQIQNSIGSISENVRSTLEEEANLLNEFTLDYGDLQIADHTAQVHCRVLPKLYTPGSTQVSLLVGEQEVPMTYQDGAYTATFSVPLFETSLKVSQVLLNDQGTIRAQAVNWESSPQEGLLQPYVDTQNNAASYQSNKMVWSPIWMNIQLQNPGKVTVKKMEIVEVLNGKEVGRLPVKLSQKGQDAYRSRLESNGFATMDAASAFENADGTFLYAFDKRYTLQSGDHLVLYLDVVDEQGVRYRSVADFASLIGRQKVDSDWEYEMADYRSRGLMVLLDPNGQVVYNANPELLYAK